MSRTTIHPYECRVCNMTWPSTEDRSEHEEYAHDFYFCTPCDREFQSRNNLNMHLRSRVHMSDPGRSCVYCPFCQASFSTATGVTHHLERGACPNAPNVNRDSIYKFVRRNDPRGVVSKNLLTWDGTSTRDGGYSAHESTWNSHGYACPLCDRQFNQLQSLDQHLQSSTHMQELYHCPNRQCARNFKTMAALINHFESESCGVLQFSQVQSGIGDMMRGQRLLGL